MTAPDGLIVGDHVTITNVAAGRIRHITRFSPYRMMLTLENPDRCVDINPALDEVTALGAGRYRVTAQEG